MTRIRAMKPHRAMFRGRYGPEEYSGGSGSVVDIPTELVPVLRGRVEVVPQTTEIRGVPLPPGTITDDLCARRRHLERAHVLMGVGSRSDTRDC
jgi:hypothetical protein